MAQVCACTTVAKAQRALTRFYEHEMLGSGMTITQFAIARALLRNGPTTLSDLSAELVMERTSLYRTIRPMTERRWVRIDDTSRGRTKLATLTGCGERAVDRAEPQWARAQGVAVAAIGTRQWNVLANALLEIPDSLARATSLR